MRIRASNKYIHAVDDDFSTGLQNFVDPAHNIASTRVDDGIEQHRPTPFREQVGELTWPILCNDAVSKNKGGSLGNEKKVRNPLDL